MPERVSNRDSDREALGCLPFGLMGLLMANLSQAAAANMGDAEIRRIKDLIEDVLDDLYEDDDEPDRMERPKGGLP